MIGYVTVGTNDLARATAFYDALLGELGATRQLELSRGVFWGVGKGSPMLGALIPFDGKPMTVGNGTMVALAIDSHEKIDARHR